MTEVDLPPRINPTLKAAPKIRQLYWCDFPRDAQLPEFWKNRPVIIMSYRNTLFSTVTVVPCTTGESNAGNKWAVPLRTTIDGKAGWAICDKVATVAVSRLTVPIRGSVIRMPEEEFNEILTKVLEWFPKLPVAD